MFVSSMKWILLFVLLIGCFYLQAQKTISGIIIDSNNRHPLSFATVQTPDGKQSIISGLNGKFRIVVPDAYTSLNVSFIGYRTMNVPVTFARENDTIALTPSPAELNEVLIYSNDDMIRRIINTTIRNKQLNNPEFYDQYECNVYYKMHMNLGGLEKMRDSSLHTKDSVANRREDSVLKLKLAGAGETHILMSETYSKRAYKRPQQLQEIVLASKFSGLSKTYFTNFVTDVLPFHVYSEYINLNGKEYNSPISKGWQQRYRFRLSEEFLLDKDTVFMMEFEPKTKTFNGLNGIIYINSNGYAISHIIASSDTTSDRVSRIEQIYTQVNNRWFPKELNYNLIIRNLYKGQGEIRQNGHSVIDSVSFDKLTVKFDKAHSEKLSDSVDLRSAEDWERFRPEPLNTKELNTYRFVDSFSKEHKLEKLIISTSTLALGRIPFGKVDLDMTRFIAGNHFEGTRLGLGLYTSNRLSRFYSVGGWVGYGTQDKSWKYGGSVMVYPDGNKENSVSFAYENTYRNPGEVVIHNELVKSALNNWLLGKVDRFEQYRLSASVRKGYWELIPEFSRTFIEPKYIDSFLAHGALKNYTSDEAAFGFRYAYGEKRVPVFDYYLASDTKYPVFYFKIAPGKISSGTYKANYIRMLTAVTYKHHINRWGNDNYRIEAGMIKASGNQPLPLSLLLAGNGIMRNNFSFYSSGGFLTMRPYDYFSDRFISGLYKHDFDWYFWDSKFSKPSLSIAHNLVYGEVGKNSILANPGIHSFNAGYHETGIMVNQLFKKNLHFADVIFSAGAFHHWSNEDWRKNTVGVFSINFGL
jgi:hypothetical protein